MRRFVVETHLNPVRASLAPAMSFGLDRTGTVIFIVPIRVMTVCFLIRDQLRWPVCMGGWAFLEHVGGGVYLP